MKIKCKFGRGFTLVELLVVIAILGILMAILLPVLAKMKARARKAQCASNQKQWGVALISYAGDNRNYFPSNVDGSHTHWMGKDMIAFLKEYLMRNIVKGSGDTVPTEHVLFCPHANTINMNSQKGH